MGCFGHGMCLINGVKLLAIVDATLSILNIFLYITPLLYFGIVQDPDEQEIIDTFLIFALIVFLVTCPVQIFMTLQLYNGAENKNYNKCQSWIIFSIIILLINAYGLIIDGDRIQMPYLRVLPGFMMYKACAILIVVKLMKRITQSKMWNFAVVLSSPESFTKTHSTDNSNQYVYTNLSIEL
ncbi:unnamed protein product [Orchesella dallaii]|uniref:Uncharacterized protein n=1 Tax=Orchesella dallaii TaxID=48710 RepID=A0ABP1QFN1_9HEXA